MQYPHSKNFKYQRTIQVMTFGGPLFIDEVTANEFEATIIRKFSAATTAISDFRMRNHLKIELADGREAWLFYSEFKLENLNLMQQHILVANNDRHFLMTYTDVAEHFENEAYSQYLTEAWQTMVSAKIAGPTPTRHGPVILMGIILGCICLFMVIFSILRRVLATRRQEQITQEFAVDLHTNPDLHPKGAKTHIAEATDHPDSKHDAQDDNDDIAI